MSIQIESIGQIAKVTTVSEDNCRAYFKLRNGMSGWSDQGDGEHDIVEHDAGDVQRFVRVLYNTPISLIDLPSLDDSVTDEFLWKPTEGNDLGFGDFVGLKGVVARARELI